MRVLEEPREGYVFVGPPELRGPSPEQITAAIEKSKSRTTLDGYLEKAGVGLRFRAENAYPQTIPSEAVPWIETMKKGGSMILCGPPGTGKTTAAVWCLAQRYRQSDLRWLARKRAFSFRAPSAALVKTRDIYRAVFKKNWDYVELLTQVGILIIDDWGAVYEHAWPLAEVDALIDARWEQNRPTCLTTNLHPSADGEGGAESLEATLPRAYSRLCQPPGPGVVILDGPDLRRPPICA